MSLRDEGLAYAEKLKNSAVSVQVRQYDGVTHGFLRLHNLFETASSALDDIAATIRETVDDGHLTA